MSQNWRTMTTKWETTTFPRHICNDGITSGSHYSAYGYVYAEGAPAAIRDGDGCGWLWDCAFCKYCGEKLIQAVFFEPTLIVVDEPDRDQP